MSLGTIWASIGLKDNYTNKADRITRATGKMSRAMGDAGKEAGRMQGALESLKRKRYDVRLGQLKDREVKKGLNDIQKHLRDVTGKPYSVKVSYRESQGGRLKRLGDGFGKKVIKPLVDSKEIVKARFEAAKLSAELFKSTGKIHRVRIETTGGGSGLLGMAKGGAKRAGGAMLGLAGGALKMGALGVGAAMAGGAGMVAKKGFSRLANIEDAQAMMTGLGYDKKTSGQAMDNALASVKGTAFGLDEAAITASGAMAAGIKPGKELEGMLKTVANAAAAAGVGMNDMGAIFNKVATSGKASNEALKQVADRGIPIYQKLADQLGVSAEDVFDMASKGKIGFDDFNKAMKAATGNVAKEKGNTVRGKMQNVGAAAGRLGANFLAGIFPSLGKGLDGLIDILDRLGEPAKAAGQAIGDIAQKASQLLGPALQKLGAVAGPYLASAMDLFGSVMNSVGIPALKFLGGVAKDLLFPALKLLATVAETVVAPVLKTLAGVAGKLLKPAFDKLGGAAKAVGKFLNGLSDAVRTVANKIANTSIRSVIGGGSGRGKSRSKSKPRRRAGGDMHYGGEVTSWNEMGREYLYAEGKYSLFPADKTRQEISKRLRHDGVGRSNPSIIINLDARNASMTPEEKRDLECRVYRTIRRAVQNAPQYA